MKNNIQLSRLETTAYVFELFFYYVGSNSTIELSNFEGLVPGCIEACQILQVNMRWKALAKIYKMHYLAPFSWNPSGTLL